MYSVINDCLTIITHTHSECDVAWKPYFDSYKKYFDIKNHVVLIDKKTNLLTQKQIEYKNNLPYSNRILDCLKHIETEFVLLSFEDMFLYDNVKTNEIENIIHIMNNDTQIFFTRLIKSGIKSNILFKDNLFLLDKQDFLFSLTPTIWRVKTLKLILQDLKNLNIWNLEVNGDLYLKNNNYKSLYYYNNELPRGGHYDSSIYPHICSAILKGKWNITEYKDVLLPILNFYGININEKGFI